MIISGHVGNDNLEKRDQYLKEHGLSESDVKLVKSYHTGKKRICIVVVKDGVSENDVKELVAKWCPFGGTARCIDGGNSYEVTINID